MPTYPLGFNTNKEIVDDTLIHLSNYDSSTSVSGVVRAYDKHCKEVAKFEITIQPLCTELIRCSTLADKTYGWMAIETSDPLLVQVLYSIKGIGVVASNLVQEAVGDWPYTAIKNPSYGVPYNSQYPGRFVETLLFISNPTRDIMPVKGGFFDQNCKMIKGTEIEIQPHCTEILRPPNGTYGWAWLDAGGQLIINILLTGKRSSTDGLRLLRQVVASDLIVRPLDQPISPKSEPAGVTGRIAFVTFHPFFDAEHIELAVINGDGSGWDFLTFNTPFFESQPAWSPDGLKIAFSSEPSNPPNSPSQIHVMNADGSGLTQLTNGSHSNGSPAWSPDGRKIAFTSDRDGQHEIYMMNADGSGQTRLTDNRSFDSDPDWSPDGRKIAFISSRDYPGQLPSLYSEIYVMNADGSGQTRLTNNLSYDGDPAWSPDGKRIAFASDRDYPGQSVGHYAEIYLMNADGSGQTRLTNTPIGGNFQPDWSSDGQKIVFVSMRDGTSGPQSWAEGKWELYVMNTDGSNQTRLTNNYTNEMLPAWAP